MQIPADWTFKNRGVAESFDTHVREQLPWYDLATGAIAHIARHYIPHNGCVYDIGASTGNIGRALAETLRVRNVRFTAIESSPEMCALYNGPGAIVQADALDWTYEPFDVAILFLLLMFLRPGARKDFVRRLCDRIAPGGALIIFDKLIVNSGYVATVLHRLTIAGKVATGAKADAIIEKELALSGVQRPLSAAFMANLSPPAIEVFRFGEFAGWVIEGPE